MCFYLLISPATTLYLYQIAGLLMAHVLPDKRLSIYDVIHSRYITAGTNNSNDLIIALIIVY